MDAESVGVCILCVCVCARVCMSPYLSEGLVEFLQDALLVEHLALVAVLVVVVDLLPEVGGQLVEGHVLLHLFVLRERREEEKEKEEEEEEEGMERQ